jgi:hypothetical protein
VEVRMGRGEKIDPMNEKEEMEEEKEDQSVFPTETG